MDLIGGFPHTSHSIEGICVIVDHWKICTFHSFHMSFSGEWLANIYIREIVRLQGVALYIISDQSSVFTSTFLGPL